MIVGKLWRALKAQLNKVANFFWKADPIAQMQYEYDRIVDQLKDGRRGLEQYRAMVERVSRQVHNNKKHIAHLESKIKAYLEMDDRTTAAKYALEMEKAQQELAENEAQLKMHEKAYENYLTKIKHSSSKLAKLRQKIQRYDADLKMSRAEAELAKVAQSINFDVDVSTNMGEIEQVIQDRIDQNRAAARVSADLSGEGMEEVEREQVMEDALAEQALRKYEKQLGSTKTAEPVRRIATTK